MSEVSMINNGLDLVFFGVLDEVRRWPRVVVPVFSRLSIRGQE